MTPYHALLQGLSRHRGVLGAMVVDARDDIIVDSAVRHGVPASTVAALAASLYRKARQSARAAGLGETGVLRMEAERGHILAAGCGDLVLIALAESSVNMGLLRVELRRAAEAIV